MAHFGSVSYSISNNFSIFSTLVLLSQECYLYIYFDKKAYAVNNSGCFPYLKDHINLIGLVSLNGKKLFHKTNDKTSFKKKKA